MSDLEYSAMSQEELLYVVQAKDAEIERLRAALKEIQSEVADHFDACAYNIAKAALEDDE
jgi:hypothetical protein